MMAVKVGMSDSADEPRSKFLQTLKEKAQRLQTEVVALMFAYRDRRTPWYAKAWAVLVVAYALSPIDLIPDFIPVLGYLDDLILIPAGIALALKMIPADVMTEARTNAFRLRSHRPGVLPGGQASDPGGGLGKWGVVVIVCIWLVVLGFVGGFVYRLIKH
jgi:uncharacterized membrane protein YkvA (DUF1232 family)